MNIELLEKVKEQVLKTPEQVNMHGWWSRETNPVHDCGTAACIAGWAVALAHPESRGVNSWCGTDEVLINGEAEHPIDVVAEDELGLSYPKASKLFYLEEWPKEMQDRYASAGTPSRRASVVADRIDLFIKTGGRE